MTASSKLKVNLWKTQPSFAIDRQPKQFSITNERFCFVLFGGQAMNFLFTIPAIYYKCWTIFKNIWYMLLRFFFLASKSTTAWKVSVFGVILARIFPHSDWMRRDTSYISVFSPNAGKYGPEELRLRTFFTQCPVFMISDIKEEKFVAKHHLLLIFKNNICQGIRKSLIFHV